MSNKFPGQLRILIYFADAEDNGSQASRAEAAEEELGYAFPYCGNQAR